MKKLNTALLAGSLCLVGASASQASALVDYAGGGLAIQDVDGFDDGLALVLNAGKNMPSVHENFFIESEFTYTISSPEITFFGGSIEASILTLAGYAAYILPLNEQFNLKGRAGILYEDVDVDSFGSDTDIGLSLGFGGEYILNDGMKITFDYTIIESDVSHLGLGIKIGLQ